MTPDQEVRAKALDAALTTLTQPGGIVSAPPTAEKVVEAAEVIYQFLNVRSGGSTYNVNVNGSGDGKQEPIEDAIVRGFEDLHKNVEKILKRVDKWVQSTGKQSSQT